MLITHPHRAGGLVAGGALKYFLAAWFAAVFAIIVMKVAMGRIRLNGLFLDDHGSVSPERIQLLLTTFATAPVIVQYSLAHHIVDAPSDLLIGGVASSHGVYVVGKSLRTTLRGPRAKHSNESRQDPHQHAHL